ncbi:MAG TPA: hypothetical protein VMW66_04870, partial [Elusimicrobiales bacterium]|nr:hypothetical protein [Elusimicrobiales bacterium]
MKAPIIIIGFIFAFLFATGSTVSAETPKPEKKEVTVKPDGNMTDKEVADICTKIFDEAQREIKRLEKELKKEETSLKALTNKDSSAAKAILKKIERINGKLNYYDEQWRWAAL